MHDDHDMPSAQTDAPMSVLIREASDGDAVAIEC